jgi:hypothetical protein
LGAEVDIKEINPTCLAQPDANCKRQDLFTIIEDMEQLKDCTFIRVCDRSEQFWFKKYSEKAHGELLARTTFYEVGKLELKGSDSLPAILCALQQDHVSSFTDLMESNTEFQAHECQVFSLELPQIEVIARVLTASSATVQVFLARRLKVCTLNYDNLSKIGNEGIYLQYTHARLCG